MSAGITKAGLAAMQEALTGYQPHNWVTLHMFDDTDPSEYLDREQGIFGPQIDNRAVVGEDMRVTLTNFYPEWVMACWVWWHEGAFQMFSVVGGMWSGDTISVDLTKLRVVSA